MLSPTPSGDDRGLHEQLWQTLGILQQPQVYRVNFPEYVSHPRLDYILALRLSSIILIWIIRLTAYFGESDQ